MAFEKPTSEALQDQAFLTQQVHEWAGRLCQLGLDNLHVHDPDAAGSLNLAMAKGEAHIEARLELGGGGPVRFILHNLAGEVGELFASIPAPSEPTQ
jgi:hypothetical protein